MSQSLPNDSSAHSHAMDPRVLLSALMKSHGLNPNSLAEATRQRTKQPQIYRFLNNIAKEPKRSTLVPVAEYFGVPVEAFFDELKAEEAAQSLGLLGHAQRPLLEPRPGPPSSLGLVLAGYLDAIPDRSVRMKALHAAMAVISDVASDHESLPLEPEANAEPSSGSGMPPEEAQSGKKLGHTT